MLTEAKIGPVKYAIREEPRLSLEGKFGQLVRPECVIELLPDMPPQLRRVTVLHEVVHEVFEQLGINAEEATVTAFAYIWAQVLDDNPGL